MPFHDDMRHLTSEKIQEFLDQGLSPHEAARVEEHLASCHGCRNEAESWSLLFAELGSLETLAPKAAFAQSVLNEAPIRTPLGLRAKSWLAPSRARSLDEAHIPQGSLQDYLEGRLQDRPAARLEAHLAACESCRKEAGAWDGFLGSLQQLGRFSPSPGFAQRVMAEVRVPAPVPARSWSSLPGRILAWARSLTPGSRRGWAIAGGVASAPTITVGALIFLVFSHPLLTVATFTSYVSWKVADLFGAFLSSVMESAAVFRGFEFLESLALTPTVLGLGGLSFSLLGAAALWVLYRNLLTPSDDRYARARV